MCTDRASNKCTREQHEIWTARGSIFFHDMELEKLKSKRLLLDNIGNFNYDSFETLRSNITLEEVNPLEAFQQLGPVQQAGVVGGLGLLLLCLCCCSICCFLNRKPLVCCSLQCTSPQPVAEESVRQKPAAQQQEDGLRQQLRAAAQYHLRQLHPEP